MSLMAFEAVLDEHPNHNLMAETLDWYVGELMDILRAGYWPSVSAEDFLPRARRYVAVWVGMRVLKQLMGLRMDSDTLAAVLLRAMGLVDTSQMVHMPRFQINVALTGEHSTSLTADEEMVVRAVFDAYDDTLSHPSSLGDIAEAAELELTDIERIFESFDDFVVAESLFEERALRAVLQGAETPMVAARRVSAFESMMLHNYGGMSAIRIAAQARSMEPSHRFHRFYSQQMMRQYKFVLGMCKRANSAQDQGSFAVELDALTIHAMWIGLSVEASYRPHTFDIGTELLNHVKLVFEPEGAQSESKLDLVR